MNWGDRLEAVMRLRVIREQRARAAVLKERLQQDEAVRRVHERRAALAAVRMPGEEIRPATLRSMQLRGLAAGELLESAAEEQRIATERLEDARRQWHRVVADRDATDELLKRRSDAAAHLARMASELSLIHISEPTRRRLESRLASGAV